MRAWQRIRTADMSKYLLVEITDWRQSRMQKWTADPTY